MRSSRAAILLAFTSFVVLPAALHAQIPDAATLREWLRVNLPDLSDSVLEELVAEHEITNLYSAPDSVRLAPVFASAIRAELAELRPAIGVEVLSIVETPGTADELLSYGILQSISTMTGIEYYSASRGYDRTLFYESYVVSDPGSSEPLPDPQPVAVPENDLLYVVQRDSSFGKNVYEVTYRAKDGAILLSMQNLSRMMYRGIVPAVGPHKLRIHIAAIPGDGFTVLYGASGVDSLNVFGIEERARESFYNRIVALHDWYLDQLAGSMP